MRRTFTSRSVVDERGCLFSRRNHFVRQNRVFYLTKWSTFAAPQSSPPNKPQNCWHFTMESIHNGKYIGVSDGVGAQFAPSMENESMKRILYRHKSAATVAVLSLMLGVSLSGCADEVDEADGDSTGNNNGDGDGGTNAACDTAPMIPGAPAPAVGTQMGNYSLVLASGERFEICEMAGKPFIVNLAGGW